jgi:hypothetical protein
MRTVSMSIVSFRASTYRRGAVSAGASASASPAMLQSARWIRSAWAMAARCDADPGTVSEEPIASSV